MSNLYTYVMQHDAGLAPNPFWDFCTLAVCTPNHQGSRAKRGDWIAGVSDKRRGYKLIHVMEVDERVHIKDYFREERFAAKKPVSDGTPQQRCGDNFYSLDAHGRWMQHPNRYHEGPSCLAQDTRHPWVFVARRFWYLGRNATQIPAQSCRCSAVGAYASITRRSSWCPSGTNGTTLRKNVFRINDMAWCRWRIR